MPLCCTLGARSGERDSPGRHPHGGRGFGQHAGFRSGAKAALYARAGIPEYWVLDVNGRRLIVHQHPVEGAYRSIQAFAEEETAQTPMTSDAAIVVRELF